MLRSSFRRAFATTATAAEIRASADALTAAGVARLNDLVVESASGAVLTTVEGEEVLDFAVGIGVVNTGHCHPRVVEAVREQAGKLMHAQMNCMYQLPQEEVARKLTSILPSEIDTFFFGNSGSEAVENAVKIARVATKKQNVIAFRGGFHGRTIGAMSLTTSKYIYMTGHYPLMPGVAISSFPYCARCPTGKDSSGACCGSAVRDFKDLLKQQSHPADTAAVIIEPVLGEGGYVPADKTFMQELAGICAEEGILLIADEVQSGFGRTGRMFAFEHYDIVPDLVVLAKGLASGMPLAAVAGKADIMNAGPPGCLGGTYGGNAVACAAASATLDVIQDEQLPQRAAELGDRLQSQLSALADRYPISDVRGLGLMVGVEFDDSTVAAGSAAAVTAAARKEGLLLLAAGAFETVRFIPPLVVTEEQLDEGVARFERALAAVFA